MVESSDRSENLGRDQREESRPRRTLNAWLPPAITLLVSAVLLVLCAVLLPKYLRSAGMETPEPRDPTVAVDPPVDANHPAIVHLPPDVLAKLYQHEYAPNVPEIWTGIGTLLLVATAILAGYLTFSQMAVERHARRTARHHEQKLREEAQQARHALTYTTISQRWNEVSFRIARMTIRQYCDDGGPDALRDKLIQLRNSFDQKYWSLLTVLDFFENLAILEKYHAISFEMADNALGVVACQYWAMFKPFIDWQRDLEPQDKHYYNEFEDFVVRVSKEHNYPNPWVDSPRSNSTTDGPRAVEATNGMPA